MSYRSVLTDIAIKLEETHPTVALLVGLLADEFDTSFTTLNSAIRELQAVSEARQTALLNKLHTLSNHIMSNEGKLDEILEYLMETRVHNDIDNAPRKK